MKALARFFLAGDERSGLVLVDAVLSQVTVLAMRIDMIGMNDLDGGGNKTVLRVYIYASP